MPPSAPRDQDSVRARGPRVRAVVVTWNGAHLLRPCLDSLVDQDGVTEVVVVDNASQDGTRDLLRGEYPQVTLLESPTNSGFAGGAELAMREGDAELVLLLNNDATLDPGSVLSMIEVMETPGNEDVAAVTAKILLAGSFVAAEAQATGFTRDGRTWVPAPPGTPQAVRLVNSTGNQVTRAGAGTDRDWLAVDGTESRETDVMGFCGGAALLRSSAVREVGGFDPSLFLYYEDTDLSWRLRAAGWRVHYDGRAVAHHQHAASSGTSSPVFRYHNTRNSLVVFGRHAPWPLVLRAYLRQAVGATLATIRRSEPRGTLAARWRGLRDAVIALPRVLDTRRKVWDQARVDRSTVAEYLR
ncbi:glycosyltransferase family 2 protein [Actinotalea sp. BY-33]|uniref:Glycosyltransferase family 2 protein n=1 Tax=Actinotalea soli TaxID=2819234 RepID=A0A939LMQ5_9CELL|nr:glycosyltransferase family 2 protein [Actinotalea soli]MBO1750957.1 glycosyltransferase family 2 protein [Actinotalea soli]